MGNGSKVAVTVICVVAFFFVGIIMLAAGSSQFFVGMVALGLFYGLRSLFKGGSEDAESKELTLDKTMHSDEPDRSIRT